MKLLKNVTIRTKMRILLIVAILFLMVNGLIGYFSLQNVKKNSDILYTQRMQAVKLVDEVRFSVRSIEAYTLELMLTKDDQYSLDLSTNIQEAMKRSDERLQTLQKLPISSEERKMIKELQETLSQYRNERFTSIQLALNQQNEEAYAYYLEHVSGLRDQVLFQLDELKKRNETGAEQLNLDNKKEAASAIMLFTIVTAVAVILLLGIGIVIVRLVVKPLRDMQSLMAKAGQGDLTVKGTYESKDEIGRLTEDFNQMIAGLRAIIITVNESAVDLSATSEQLTATSESTKTAALHLVSAMEHVQEGAEAQLRGTNESARAMEEMAIGIGRIAESASTVSESSTEAATEAQNGQHVIQNVVKQIDSLRDSVQQSADVVKQLGEHSQRIGNILSVITAIADQTNLLALNAAIEAARAGEHGKGFAVVADEVRKLAEESRKSAEQISDLIRQIQHDTGEAVIAMEKGTENAELGMKVVHQAGEAFNAIVHKVERVAEQIQEVSAISEQMAASSQEVTASVIDMDKIADASLQRSKEAASLTNEQLETIEEINGSTNSLRKMSQDLQFLTQAFKL
jgi:methyl-accepting chemotaxis protein